MIKDLQTNVDKIIELELRLDDAKESYKNLESLELIKSVIFCLS